MLQNFSSSINNYLEYILILFIAGFLIHSMPSFMANTMIGIFCIETIHLINKFALDFPLISFAMVLLFILLDSKQDFCLLKGLKIYFCQRRFNKYVDCSTISALIVLLLKQEWGLFVTSFILYLIWCLFRFLREEKNDLISKQDENIDTDEPIESKDKDFLGRGNFAEEISEKIRCLESNDSLVVGLYGEWGSGKSSFLNLMKKYLKEKNTLVLEFNPWFFTSAENLFTCFLEFYYDEMKKNKLVTHKRLIKFLKKYMYQVAKTQFKAEKVVFSLENFLPWDFPSDSIKSLKKEIDEELAKLDQRIVIIIDDIDRLNPLEIRQMVTLVKLIADFPKTTYILSFDDKVVAKVLAEEYKLETNYIGDKFLEKIIQMPVRLPMQDSYQVEGEFISRLLKKMPQVDKNNLRFSAFQDYTLPIISNNTVRQFKRYLNSLEMGLSMINRQEIDAYDYLYIEFLRNYFYPIYEFILKYKTILTSEEAAFILDPSKENKRNSDIVNSFRKSFEQCCRYLNTFEKGLITKVMRELFTQFDDILDKQTYHVGIKEQLMDEDRNNRICSSANFDKYFMYEVSANDISTDAFIEFVAYINKERNVDIIKVADITHENRINNRLLAKIRIHKTRFHAERVYDLAIILVRKKWAKDEYKKVMAVLIDLLYITTDKSRFISDVTEEASPLLFAHFVYRRFKNETSIITEDDARQISGLIYTKIQSEIDEIGADFITKYSDDFTLLINSLREIKNKEYVEETIRKWLTNCRIIENFLLVFSEEKHFTSMSYSFLTGIFPIEEMVELVETYCSGDNKIVEEFLNEHKANVD